MELNEKVSYNLIWLVSILITDYRGLIKVNISKIKE